MRISKSGPDSALTEEQVRQRQRDSLLGMVICEADADWWFALADSWLARRAEIERLRGALDVLSRWPPPDGMLAMCEFARAALAGAEKP